MDNINNINDYVCALVENRYYLKKQYKIFVRECYSVNNIDGIISASVLKELIKKARKNRFLRQMLVDILLYVDKDSMTNENFSLLLRFSKKNTKKFLSSLSHCEISFYQMQIVNKKISDYESFCWLFNHMCSYDAFSTFDIENLIHESFGITKYGLENCIKYAIEKHGVSDKIRIAKEICQKMQE